MIKPFIDLGSEAIQLLTTALGRLLRELITELEELSLAIAEADPRWNR